FSGISDDTMNGTFNGVPIENGIALKIYETRTSLRVLGCPGRQLVRQFKRGSPADVKVSIHEFKGRSCVIAVQFRWRLRNLDPIGGISVSPSSSAFPLVRWLLEMGVRLYPASSH